MSSLMEKGGKKAGKLIAKSYLPGLDMHGER